MRYAAQSMGYYSNATELCDKLRALVTRLLNEEGTLSGLIAEATPLGVVFPYDIGKEVYQLRTMISRISSDGTYTCNQAVRDARALDIEVVEPNAQLTKWRNAEAENQRTVVRLRKKFEASGITIHTKYALNNDDAVFVQDVRFDLGIQVKIFNAALNFEMWMDFDDFLKKSPRVIAG